MVIRKLLLAALYTSSLLLSFLGSRAAMFGRGVPPCSFRDIWIEPLLGLANLLLLLTFWKGCLTKWRYIYMHFVIVSVFPALGIVNCWQHRPHPGSHGGPMAIVQSAPVSFLAIMMIVSAVGLSVFLALFSILSILERNNVMVRCTAKQGTVRGLLIISLVMAVQLASYRVLMMN